MVGGGEYLINVLLRVYFDVFFDVCFNFRPSKQSLFYVAGVL